MATPQTGRFDGRVALVTGAAGAGIGSAIASRLASEGAAIVAVDHHQPRTEALVERLKAEHDVAVVGFAIDVADRPAVDDMLAEAAQAVGDIDIVVNSAAINVQGSIFDYQADDFDQVIAVDLTACWYLIRQTIGPMRQIGTGFDRQHRFGRRLQRRPRPGGALLGVQGGPARADPQRGDRGGPLRHPLQRHRARPDLVQVRRQAQARFAVEAEATPLRRHGRPEEIANVVAFLVSDESSLHHRRGHQRERGLVPVPVTESRGRRPDARVPHYRRRQPLLRDAGCLLPPHRKALRRSQPLREEGRRRQRRHAPRRAALHLLGSEVRHAPTPLDR